MRHILYTIFAVSLLSLCSCKKNKLESPNDTSSFYFPIEVGYTWTYEMDSISFKGTLAIPDTFTFQIRNKVVDTFRTASGEKTFIIERLQRPDAGSTFSFRRSFTETKAAGYALRQEFSQTKVIHDFPIVENKEWDGNQFNAKGEIETFYQDVHIPFTVLAQQYDSTATVFHEDAINAVQSMYEREIFAKNIGLIYKEVEDLQNINTPQLKGNKYEFRLLSFEK